MGGEFLFMWQWVSQESPLHCDRHEKLLSSGTRSCVLLAGLLRELLCIVMHCPAISATGAPVDFNNYNNLKTDLRHGVQVVGGSNPLAPTNYFKDLHYFLRIIPV